MRIEALFFWFGTILFVVGMGLAAGLPGYLAALGGAIILFTLSARRH